MKVNGMPMRGLDENIIDFIKNSDEAKGLREIIDSIRDGNEEELFIGIRNNFIAVYFRRKCVFKKIAFKIEGDKIVFSNVEIDKAYLEFVDSNEAKESLICLEGVKKIKKGIVEHFKRTGNWKYEHIYQQEIVLVNNGESNSKWFCFDMEYDMGQSGFGRYDILAITTVPNRLGKYNLALIELKVDGGAFFTATSKVEKLISGGVVKTKMNLDTNWYSYTLGSGILGHFSDYVRYLNDKGYNEKFGYTRLETTKCETINILKNYVELGLCDENIKEFVNKLTVEQISSTPQFIFLTYSRKSKIKRLKDAFSEYVLGGNTYPVVDFWDEKVIDLYRNDDSEIQFKCIFKEGLPEDEANRAIFSDVEISEAKNIFDEEAYK